MTLACGGGDGPAVPADVTVLVGPRFVTDDPAQPEVEALIVSEGRIAGFTTRREIPKLIAGGGTVRQLPGAVAVAGLTDAHGHLVGLAQSAHRVDLVGTTSLEDALARIEAFAGGHPEAAWIVGRGWDQNDWPDHAWPDADRLEQAVAGRPCAMWRVDGHALWVNRTALAAARIGAGTVDPPGGMIRRDGAGRPTGILVDEASTLVEKLIPALTRAELEKGLAAAAAQLVAVGLTGVHEMGIDRAQWDAMRNLANRGFFPLRVTAYASFDSDLHHDIETSGPLDFRQLRVAGVKLYADGALGSRGARLAAPYEDERRTTGLWITEPAALEQRVAAAFRAGLQPAIHAIGDAANGAALDAIERGLAAVPAARALRPRLEHAQIVDPTHIPRFAALGAIASMQPTHATSDMPWAEDRVGPGRLAGAYAWKSMLRAGAALAFGSDFPVESPDPRLGLYAAVTRQDSQGHPAGGWLPAERLDLREALAAFSRGAAFAAHQETELGRIAPTYWCDLTVFDTDPFATPRAVLDAKVVATVIAGQLVWPAPGR